MKYPISEIIYRVEKAPKNLWVGTILLKPDHQTVEDWPQGNNFVENILVSGCILRKNDILSDNMRCGQGKCISERNRKEYFPHGQRHCDQIGRLQHVEGQTPLTP